MCRKVVYPEMNQEVRMEVIDGDVYFSVMDVAHCMKRHPSNLTKSSCGFEIGKRRFRDESKKCSIVGIDNATVHRIANKSRRGYEDFLSWLDKIYEENKPKEPEVAMPMPVEDTEHNFDKEKMKAFFEGAAEFLNMCSKMIA